MLLKQIIDSDLLGSLEDIAVLSLAGKRNPEFQQLHKCIREVLEEDIIVLGIPLDVLLELLVLDQGQVRGHHHQSAGGLIRELLRTVPLLLIPALLEQQPVELIGEDGRAEIPRPVESRPVSVRAAQRMGAHQSHNLLVVEAHAVEDVADVLVVLGAVGETAVRCAGGHILVLTTGAPGDGWAAEFLDRTGTSQGPEVGVGDPGKFGLDGLQPVSGDLETGVGAVVRFGGESHRGTIASSCAGFLVIGTASVPCETKHNLIAEFQCQLLIHVYCSIDISSE